MKPMHPTAYVTLVTLLTLSFWSSGVMLIRFLDSLQAWSRPSLLLGLIYLISVPLIFFSIAGVQKIFVRSSRHASAVRQITGLVLTLHAVVITLQPSLYLFTPESAPYATAWLLWFGGIAIVLETRNR